MPATGDSAKGRFERSCPFCRSARALCRMHSLMFDAATPGAATLGSSAALAIANAIYSNREEYLKTWRRLHVGVDLPSEEESCESRESPSPGKASVDRHAPDPVRLPATSSKAMPARRRSSSEAAVEASPGPLVEPGDVVPHAESGDPAASTQTALPARIVRSDDTRASIDTWRRGQWR
jgi:hypothetical protein